MTARSRPGRSHGLRWPALLMTIAVIGLVLPVVAAEPAQAAACSTSTPASTCDIGTSTTVTAGSLGVSAPATLSWNFVQSGYDQVQSGSAGTLSGCTSTARATTCSTGAVAPLVQVVDARGATSGWALSAYVSSSNLPTNTALSFNGAGTTIGASSVGTTIGASTPTTVCDYTSNCTVPTAATTCTHTASPNLGFATCPAYPTNLLNGTSATAQVDLYSANANTGLGAICLGSTSPTAVGCTGTTPKAFFNMTMPAAAAAGTYSGAVITLTATSGP